MTELELYRFVEDKDIEWHRNDNEGIPDVIAFVYPFDVEEFSQMIKSYLRDEGVECRLMDGYFAFWVKDICDHYDIDMDNVFKGEEK